MQQRKPYSSNDLGSMITDCIAYLNQSPMLHVCQGKAKRTGDRASMFVVECQATIDDSSVAGIIAELERIWMKDLRFDGESPRAEYHDQVVRFDFITWWESPEGAYVTGSFVVKVPSHS
jgi:hypothetical protein